MKSKFALFVVIVCLIVSFTSVNFYAINAAEATTWTKLIESSKDTLQAVTYSGNLLVAVGENGLIRTSVDGDNWLYQSSGTANNLNDVAYGAGLFVACGNSGTILTSKDGTKWSSVKTNTKYNLSTVFFDNSKFIAVGEHGILLVSGDTIKWDILVTSINDSLTDICMNDSTYIIGGYSGLYISKDLMNWTHIKESENRTIKTIVFDGKKLLAITQGNYERREELGGVRDTYSYVLISTDGSNWSKEEIHGAFNKVIWDGKRFFAINGITGIWGSEQEVQIRTSNDGIEWSSEMLEHIGILNDLVWTGEYYIGVGYQNSILKSIDGEKWTDLTIDTLSESLGIVSDGNSFVSLGNEGNIMVTKDMKSWTNAKISDAYHLDSIYWRDGAFYIWGSEKAYSSNKCLFISKDLKKWDEFKTTSGFFTTFSNQHINRVIYNGNRFVCGFKWSDDGIEWDKSEQEFQNGNEAFYDGIWDGKNYYQVGSSIISSTDGIKWINHPITEGELLKGVTYSGNRYLAVGCYGDFDNQKGVVYYSIDGKIWTRKVLDCSGLNTVVWTGKSFIAAGNDGTIMESKDGIKWSDHYTNTKEAFNLMSIGKNGLVAISNSGNIFYLNQKINFDKILNLSPNAPEINPVPDDILEWNVIDLETENEFQKVIWTGKEFVTVGENGMLAFSKDGQTWDKRTIDGLGKITGIAYNDKKFVAIGKASNGEEVIIVSSSDGIKWTQHELKNKSYTSGNIIWNGKMFVALGGSPVQIYSSEDGEVWKEFSTQCLSDYHNSVVWDGTKFITLVSGMSNLSYVSQDSVNWSENNVWLPYGYISNIHYLSNTLIATGQGRIATSNDGSTWSIGNCPTASQIKDLIYDGKRYLAFTDEDRILQSENIKDWNFKYSTTPFNFNSVSWNGNAYIGVGKGKIAIAYPKAFPKVLIGNTPLRFDVAPVNVNSRVLVPMRTIFEQLGAEVEWDDSKKQVTATKGNKTIKLRIGDPIANINDAEYTLDSPAKIVNGRTMIPIRFICSSFDADVEWVDKDKTVKINIQK